MARPTRRYHVPSPVRSSELRLEADAARELVTAGALLIDVRRHDDRSEPLGRAVRIPPDEMPARVADFPRGATIVLACT
jgi:rhodanese-related sulfurtransferase